MMLGLSLRVSWICLLLFSSGACFPAKGGDYAPGSSNLQPEGSSRPLVHHQPSANPGSPTGNHASSSMAAGYAPSLPISYSSAGYTSHPAGSGSGSVYRQPSVGSGSGSVYRQPSAGAGSGLVYRQPSAGSSAGYTSHPTGSGSGSGSVYRQPSAGSGSVYGDTSGFAYSAGNADNAFGSSGSSGPLSGGAASDLNAWIEARPFIDLSFLESAQGMLEGLSQETSLPVPSSYIVQSRNGYLRDRQAYSHKTYDPEFPEAPVLMSAPASGSKGGKV